MGEDMDLISSDDIYNAGYAIPIYHIAASRRLWRFKQETIELPSDAVKLHEIPGIYFPVASVDDVRAAADVEKAKGSM